LAAADKIPTQIKKVKFASSLNLLRGLVNLTALPLHPAPIRIVTYVINIPKKYVHSDIKKWGPFFPKNGMFFLKIYVFFAFTFPISNKLACIEDYRE